MWLNCSTHAGLCWALWAASPWSSLPSGGGISPLGDSAVGLRLTDNPDTLAELKVKEIKNNRLTWFLLLDHYAKAVMNGESPAKHWASHATDPFARSGLTAVCALQSTTTTTWVPVGARVYVLSLNHHPNPSQGRQNSFVKNSILKKFSGREQQFWGFWGDHGPGYSQYVDPHGCQSAEDVPLLP